MSAVRTPEILEADLTALVLDTASWGEHDVENLPWLTPPAKADVAYARRLLTSLGALDGEGRVTAWGRRLAKLPCHPRIARMLLSADSDERRALAADIAALIEEKDPMAGENDVAMDRRLDALRRERRNGKGGPWGRMARTARQYADMIHAKVDNTAVNPYVRALVCSNCREANWWQWSLRMLCRALSGLPSRQCTGKWGAWEKSSWQVSSTRPI